MSESSVQGFLQPTDATRSNSLARRPHKRRRQLSKQDVNETPHGENRLARLPLEMLHEILSWTTPQDILALSRTSRYFCVMLISDPKLWRDARRHFLPHPIPDPAPNWTESAYIAFLFDGKPCEVCGRITCTTPVSYSLRGHVCKKVTCKEEWFKSLKYISSAGDDVADLLHIKAVQSWLPYNESPSANPLHAGSKGYRLTEWEAAIQQHKESMQEQQNHPVVQRDFARKAKHLPQIMKCARMLNVWGRKFEKWRTEVNAANIEFLQNKAKEENWDLRDLGNTLLYRSLRIHHNKVYQKITDKDFDLLKDQFRKEVAKQGEMRIRRIIDNTTRVNREDLRKYWNMLQTGAKNPLPPYSEFRQLSIIKTLERKNATESVALAGSTDLEPLSRELKTNRGTQNHIQQEIDNWLRVIRKTLAVKLGDPYPVLATISGTVQTVDRTTAWFLCTRCEKVCKNHLEGQGLTFANICTHRCRGLTKTDRLSCPWDVNLFEPDIKAIAAAKELLRVCSLDERHATKQSLDGFGCRFLCKSCTEPIVMPAASVIDHSKRHDTITLELLPENHATEILNAPLERGLVSTLMGSSKSGKKMRYKPIYACRHCEDPKVFAFDGLRSHMKSKHDIKHIRDEDMRTVEQPAVQETR